MKNGVTRPASGQRYQVKNSTSATRIATRAELARLPEALHAVGSHACVARRHDRLLGRARGRQLAAHAALAHDEDPIGEREHFRQIARHDEAGHAARRVGANEVVDLELGADVDAFRRLVEQQHAPGRSPATCRRRPSADCRRSTRPASASTDGGPDRQRLDLRPRERRFARRGRRCAQRACFAACGSARLWRRLRLKNRPEALAIFRHQREAGARRRRAPNETRRVTARHSTLARRRAARGRRPSRAARCGPTRPGRTARRSRRARTLKRDVFERTAAREACAPPAPATRRTATTVSRDAARAARGRPSRARSSSGVVSARDEGADELRRRAAR